MPIRDLLWACPLCGAEESIRQESAGETCRGCGAVFRRGARAQIEALAPDGTVVARDAADWAASLPPLPLPEEGHDDDEVTYRQALAVVRFANSYTSVRHAGRFIGRVERFGPELAGTLRLTGRALTFTPTAGAPLEWPLEAVSAVQPSSGALQIKLRGQPVVAVRFPDGSVRLWEELIQAAIRRLYLRTGRGEVLEFQPRIAVR